MRRKDREIIDPEKIDAILSACTCCRLGLCDGDRAYIVPLNFGISREDGHYTFYFHSAAQGRKLELIARTHYASFETDTNYLLHEAETACGHSARFQCIMGGGPVEFVEDPEEKQAALRQIMAHNTGRTDWRFDPAMVSAVRVFRLRVEELSCKEHL